MAVGRDITSAALEIESCLHIPVLIEESLAALMLTAGGRYIDATVGAGGHAAAICERIQPEGRLLGIDADPEAIEIAERRLESYGSAVTLVNANFRDLRAIAEGFGFHSVQGILFDLGMSSIQLGDPRRGFSFQEDGPLDMRFSPEQEITAAHLVNTLPEAELADILRSLGEERLCRRIARHIVANRPLQTTGELARIVAQALGGRRGRLHPATRTFMALRLAVNEELDNLESGLTQAIDLLDPGGRLVVISFHSLEDRIVKRTIQRESQGCICPPRTPVCICGHRPRLRKVAKGVVRPSEAEVATNPRSRSARLRVAERLLDER